MGYPYLPNMHLLYHGVPIANQSICALYYSDPHLNHHVVCAASSLLLGELDRLHSPHSPTYRTPLHMEERFPDTMYYAEASLKGLFRVQLCMDVEYCIGILLHYETYSKTVGQVRYDKDIRDFPNACSFRLVQEHHDQNPQIHVRVFDERSTEETKNSCLRLVDGTIVWHHGKLRG